MNIYLLAKKNDAFESYKDYETWCQTQLDGPVKILHSDRGGEYLGQEFILYQIPKERSRNSPYMTHHSIME